MDLFAVFSDFLGSPIFRLLTNLFFLFLMMLWVSLVYWTYRDAKKRGAFAFYWAIVVLFFNVFGWIIYLIVRPPEFLEEVKDRELDIRTKEALLGRTSTVCPACFKPIEGDFLICPYCMKKLKKPCPSCGRPLKMGWTVCPYCRMSL